MCSCLAYRACLKQLVGSVCKSSLPAHPWGGASPNAASAAEGAGGFPPPTAAAGPAGTAACNCCCDGSPQGACTCCAGTPSLLLLATAAGQEKEATATWRTATALPVFTAAAKWEEAEEALGCCQGRQTPDV